MAKNLDPKCKQCRREGTKLFLKGEKCYSPKCPIVRRNYPPGVHGAKGRKHPTEYGIQLREKQKAKRIYGILERQFKNYYQKAIVKKGNTGEFLSQLLETRLDNVIYRMGLAKSRGLARQLISHGHFLINGKRVNIPSYQVKVKDKVAIKPNRLNSKIFQDLSKTLEKYEFPTWLIFDSKTKEGKILSKPEITEVEKLFDPRLIVEFYSR